MLITKERWCKDYGHEGEVAFSRVGEKDHGHRGQSMALDGQTVLPFCSY